MNRQRDQKWFVLTMVLVTFFFITWQVSTLLHIDVTYLGEELKRETLLVYVGLIALIPLGLLLLVWLPGLVIVSFSWAGLVSDWPPNSTKPIRKERHKTSVLPCRYHRSTLQVFRC